jgi:hypothetical protein
VVFDIAGCVEVADRLASTCFSGSRNATKAATNTTTPKSRSAPFFRFFGAGDVGASVGNCGGWGCILKDKWMRYLYAINE